MYGYHRRTSPNIDRIARDGVRFEQCYTPDAPCLPSRTAFYSGRFGIHTGVVGHGGTAAQPKVEGQHRGFRDLFAVQGLATRLQNAGFHTAMISPFGQRHSAHWFYAGFNEIHNTGQGGMESAEVVKPVIDRWLQANASGDNWYLHVNFWDPHTPYRAPASLGEPFEHAPLPAHLDDPELIKRHLKKTGPHSALDLGMFNDADSVRWPRQVDRIDDLASMKKWIDGYDTAVLYVDQQIGAIVEHLKAAGVYEQTAIIISADHGENQGELGIYGEHATADVATCRVPMILKWPGGRSNAIDRGLHYNLDLAPTLMQLLKQDPSPLWDGHSYADVLQDDVDRGREQLVLSQCCHVCQRSVRWGSWLYIRTYHDGFHLFPEEMLFDLESDPFEQNDIASARQEVCHEGGWRLANWHEKQMQKIAKTASDVIDPLWTVMREGGPAHALDDPSRSPLSKYLTRLEQTGRAEGAALLRLKYAQSIRSV